MPATTNVNFRTVVHEKSNGMAMFFPDVCKTPAPPAGPIPIPYPNIAMSTDTDKGSEKVKIDGCPVMLDGSNFKTSTGDEAGSAGGVVSSKTKGKAEFVNFSFDVKIEGKGVPRLADMMLGNKGGSPNTPPMPEIQGPLIMIPPMDQEETAKKWKLKKMETEDPDSEDETEEEGTGGGKAARKGGGAGKAAGPDKGEKKKPPTIKAKWSKAEVVPAHDIASLPEECKVIPQVDLENVPDGTAATIVIKHAATGSVVKGGRLDKLTVKGGKVCDPATNKPPEWTFQAEHKPWEKWDTPFYYFTATVDFLDLKIETPKDFKAAEADVLRVGYWHACVSDAIADAGGLTTGAEMAEISGILAGQPHHKTVQKAFNANSIPVSDWGDVIVNTYAYHHASHGAIQCNTDLGRYFGSDSESNPTVCPVDASHGGRSVLVIGNTNFGAAEVNMKDKVASVPRYLVYINTCVAGYESSFGKSFVSRGTRNVVAFKKYIPDGDARQMARDFYGKWCNTHKSDPEKIPEVFFDVGAAYYGSMRPVLYGKGGGSIKDPGGLTALETAAIVIGAIAVGAAIGFGIYTLLK